MKTRWQRLRTRHRVSGLVQRNVERAFSIVRDKNIVISIPTP
jgi:hypothetical protein